MVSILEDEEQAPFIPGPRYHGVFSKTRVNRQAKRAVEIAGRLTERGIFRIFNAGATDRLRSGYRDVYAQPVPGRTNVRIFDWAAGDMIICKLQTWLSLRPERQAAAPRVKFVKMALRRLERQSKLTRAALEFCKQERTNGR